MIYAGMTTDLFAYVPMWRTLALIVFSRPDRDRQAES